MRDISRKHLASVELSLGNKACDKLRDTILEKGAEAQDWYTQKKVPKRRWALAMRGGGLILAVLAPFATVAVTLLPKSVFEQFDMQKVAAGATMVLSLAAGTVVLDKFFGWSSGWIRYSRALCELQSRDEQFQLNYQIEQAKIGAVGSVGFDTLKPLFDLIQGYLRDVQDIVRKETEQWATEFGQSLGDAERYVQAQKIPRPEAQQGSLSLEVPFVADLDGHTFTLRVNDREEQLVAGSTKVVDRLEPGIVHVRIAGRSGSLPVEIEDTAVVEPGKVTSLKLKPRGLLEIQLPEFDKLEPLQTRIIVNNRPELDVISRKIVLSLEPGQVRIAARGKIAGKEVRSESSALVEPGKTVAAPVIFA